MSFHLHQPEDPSWMAALTAPHVAHDFYQLPTYCQLEAQRIDGRAVLAEANNGTHKVIVPLILRPVPALGTDASGLVDGTSPYGYGSLLMTKDIDAETADALMTELMTGLAGHNIVCAFIRLHPLLMQHTDVLSKHGQYIVHGETVWMDLTVPVEELWRQTRSSDRNRMNKLRRRGFTTRMDSSWETMDDFLKLYEQTMGRVQADDWFFFDRSYFEGLRTALGDEQIHLCAVEFEGQLTAAGLFTLVDGMVQFHLSGTNPDFFRDSPARLMIDHVRKWGKEQGATAMHLGGGVGARDDALFKFKAGLSKLKAEFGTFRITPKPDQLAQLTQAWKQAASADPKEGFFPAYRQALS